MFNYSSSREDSFFLPSFRPLQSFVGKHKIRILRVHFTETQYTHRGPSNFLENVRGSDGFGTALRVNAYH